MIPALVTAAMAALPVQAAMTAEEFDAYTQGKTLFYSKNGADYGVERYKPNREVEWSYLDGECIDGTWYEDNGAICFAYDGWESPQCWYFEQTPDGLMAEFTLDDGRETEYMATERDEDMLCLGPKTGV